MMAYDFEWDPAKAVLNRRKHGVTFEEAATIFLDPRALSVYDASHGESEDRWISLGISSGGRLLVVCHTFSEEEPSRCIVRIVSCRKATGREERTYAS